MGGIIVRRDIENRSERLKSTKNKIFQALSIMTQQQIEIKEAVKEGILEALQEFMSNNKHKVRKKIEYR